MVLALRYRNLSNTVSETSKLANELGQYCDELSRKVQQKMYSVDGGMSSALNNADYYVNRKIEQLRSHETNARNIAAKTQDLMETAKRVDEDVARTIKANQKVFFVEYPELKPTGYKLMVISFLCNVKDVPVIGWLINGGEQVVSAIEQLKEEIKYWWKCGGGREIIMNCLDIVIKIGFAVAAVLTAVAAVGALIAATVVTAGAIIFAVAACVSALIAVVNAGANFYTSVQAMNASAQKDPAMAKIYGERDTLAQILRDHNFHDRTKNRNSVMWANRIEITDAIAGVVMIVHSIGEIAGNFLTGKGVGFAFKELVRGKDGKLTKKVTLSSIWKGTKALFLNQKLTTTTEKGLRTTLITNIRKSIVQSFDTVKYQATLFKYAIRDPGRWWKAKQVGDLGFFQNIAEKAHYKFWQVKNTAVSFRDGNFKRKLDVLTKITDNVNASFGKLKTFLERVDHPDGKNFIQRKFEKYTQDTLFDNDFSKLIDKTGVGYIFVQFDKSGIVEDYTGFGEGLIQKIQDLWEKIENAGKIPGFTFSSFQDLHPEYECTIDNAYAT